MTPFLSKISSQQGQRVLEISLTVVVLLVVFSVGGVPLILLSTFPPSWRHGASDNQKHDVFNLAALGAPETV